MGMFCFQCQEAAGGKGCSVKGVCGKEPHTSELMDVLMGEVLGAAVLNRGLREKGAAGKELSHAILDALFCTITNANFDDAAIQRRIEKIAALKQKLGGENPTTGTAGGVLSEPNEDIRSLKQMIIYGVKGAAAYAEHARSMPRSKMRWRR